MKKTQAILKKLNIVASSLEEMSFLQESNEIHKVFIKIVSNHNTRLAQGQNIIDEALDPVVQREQDSIKEKQPPLGYHEANKRILFFILS